MQKITLGLGVIALSAGSAVAGGLDRSGQSITSIFKEGGYAELSYGSVAPSVSGVFAGALDSGNVGTSYNQLSFAVKTDLSPKLSLGLIFDQPVGANVDYTDPTYVLGGTSATVESSAITLIGRYKFSDALSVHAGVRQVSANGEVLLAQFGVPQYQATMSTASDVGYLAGVAFEKPDIALRVALTYFTGTTHDMDTTVGGAPAGVTSVELPQSVNLDFQTGIAANTLLFGSIRWADWTVTEISPPFYPFNPLVSYDNDVITYSVGVGRKFSDSFSGAVTLGYEATTGDLASNLSPTDGYLSIGLGGTYTMNNMEITGGVRYVQLGDAITKDIAADFSGNSALGLGVKVAFKF